MQHDAVTPLSMFFQAGPVVQAVILILAAASVWCWVVIIECLVSVRRLGRAIGADEGRPGSGALLVPVWRAGDDAARVVVIGEDIGAARSRIESAMRRRAAELIEAAEGGLPTLAVIASSAPFVGLFGTVWGIMSSFIGIAAAKDTSLAVVAPGIAEALAATAIGLAAAIPAAVGYNRIGAALTRAGRRLGRRIEARVHELHAPAGARAAAAAAD
ncbi:MAG: MotA/TolQ/ExbB proton channel family protein [Alphaproteobacteria bacterium]|nr:MotA/TolQ/ExbB proton channel family protein [Alphaproteobacteria bacterium]